MNQKTLTLKDVSRETQLDRIERKLDELLAKRDPVKAKAATAYTHEFEELWKLYPSRGPGCSNPKKNAYNAYRARLRDGYTHDQMYQGVHGYRDVCEFTNKINTELVMQASRFLGPNLEFMQEWTRPVRKLKLPTDDSQLPSFAADHGFSQPRPGENYYDYRRRLQREIDRD